MNTSEIAENAYVVVVAKKCRNIRKKLEKIAKAEQQRQSGKPLNDEQIALVASKPNVEKLLAEFEAIKNQLEEIAVASTPAAATATMSLEQTTTTTQCEPEPAPTPKADPATETELADKYITKLITTLHICSRYTNATGLPISPDLLYFGKTLLGETSVAPFQDTLQNSLRAARIYLDDKAAAANEVSRGLTYADISSLVDELYSQITSRQRSTSSMSEEPKLNFFAVPPSTTMPEEPDDGFVHVSHASLAVIESPTNISAPAPLPRENAPETANEPKEKRQRYRKRGGGKSEKAQEVAQAGADAPAAAPAEKKTPRQPREPKESKDGNKEGKEPRENKRGPRQPRNKNETQPQQTPDAPPAEKQQQQQQRRSRPKPAASSEARSDAKPNTERRPRPPRQHKEQQSKPPVSA